MIAGSSSNYGANVWGLDRALWWGAARRLAIGRPSSIGHDDTTTRRHDGLRTRMVPTTCRRFGSGTARREERARRVVSVHPFA